MENNKKRNKSRNKDNQNNQNNFNIGNNSVKTEELAAAENRSTRTTQNSSSNAAKGLNTEQIRTIIINLLKILLPVAACILVIAVIVSFTNSRKNKETEDVVANVEEVEVDPLEKNAHEDINQLMRAFYTALADGDIDTIKALKDYNDDRELITYEKKSEFIEAYENINCYTKAGLEENSYFVYVTYELKVKDIETKAPGLEAFYVYSKADGSLMIDGRKEENIMAALKLITSQDDVVDLYNKIDVSYTEVVASDEKLNTFLTELPEQITASVGEALAQLETDADTGSEAQTEGETIPETETTPVPEQEASEEQPQNQVVNQTVRATDTVNVRSSDSEEADKIGKINPGTELTRTEERVNGWSKVIFEGQEAYIKSDYLEVVATNTNTEPNPNPVEPAETGAAGFVTATTNVNVRNAASQDADRIGTAEGGVSYELLEDMGEWYKINYKGSTGYVKAEFFSR